MQDFSDWQAASAPLYEKNNLSQKHGLLGDFGVGPLGVPSKPSIEASLPPMALFQDIVAFSDETFTAEFIKQPGATAWLAEEWPEALNEYTLDVYFKASPKLTSFKKAILQSDKFASLNLGVDPYSLGLWKSTLFKSQIEAETLSLAFEKKARVFRLSTQPYSMAGASVIQQLAILLSSLVQLVENYRGQFEPSQVLSATSIELALHPHIFMGLSELQALRLLQDRLCEIYQCDVEIPIYVAPAIRFYSAREPWNNILRLTTTSSVAQMGGAQGFVNPAYDMFSKKPVGGVTSRNIPQVLELESHLGRVSLPAQGSYTLQQQALAYCEKSWQLFQEIQKKEGFLTTLRSGWLHDLIGEEARQQETSFISGEMSIVGANQFPLLNPLSENFPFPKGEDCFNAETWWETQYSDEGCEHLCDVARLIPKSLPRLLEKWQFLGDELSSGKPQRVTVDAYIEPGLEKSEKLKMCKKILAAGGLQLRTDTVEATHGVSLIVASDPDGDYAQKTINELQQGSGVLKLWAGERDLPGFDYFVGKTTDALSLYEKIYDQLGRQR